MCRIIVLPIKLNKLNHKQRKEIITNIMNKLSNKHKILINAPKIKYNKQLNKYFLITIENINVTKHTLKLSTDKLDQLFKQIELELNQLLEEEIYRLKEIQKYKHQEKIKEEHKHSYKYKL